MGGTNEKNYNDIRNILTSSSQLKILINYDYWMLSLIRSDSKKVSHMKSIQTFFLSWKDLENLPTEDPLQVDISNYINM